MPSAPRRERKVVTVVFCDLVGFTARAESLDPEDVDAFLGPYHERVRAELERHGGTVEKFIGDAVMALFGAPMAHEDDPERAVRAALAIREFAVEEGLELRVGITTGEALVRLDAEPGAGEGMASGDVVNTAARLQSAAPVNGILVDETTFRATRQAIGYDAADPVDAKGKSAPVSVWHATEARSRFGVDTAHDARSELVGRERELGVVRDAFERAHHERTPQLLTLVGVPGIGKSRLVYELQRIVDADPDLVTWRQGRCLAYGDGVTLWALTEIVKAQAGITEQDPPEEVAEKLRVAADDVLPESDAAWVESHLRALVGVAEETELGGNRRNEAFSAWRRFLEGLAEQRPVVLVFEDLHWADETLLDFVDELVDWLTDVPLLVVATARPELLERRPGWGGGKLNATTLALPPLGEEQTAQLLARLLGRPVLAADAQRALLDRAGGNPLYAEQFVDLYMERGSTADLPLPETLQGIIAARLDGLPGAEKELLKDAAVIGKVFWTGAVGRDGDAERTVHSLERKGFVRRQRRSSLEGESEYAFAHALVRDVAYGQIARADRAAKHQWVAEWIESLGRPEDHAEMRAYHWRSALELVRASGAADGELVEHARIALRDAGDRASGLNGHAAAAALYEQALALWWDDEPDRADLQFRRARALFHAYDEERREQALETARDSLLASGDTARAAEAESLLCHVAWDRGHGDIVHERMRRAEELIGDSRSPSAARVLATAARMRELDDEHEEALRVARAALDLADELGLDPLRAHALTTIGMAKNELGTTREGIADMERALAIALDANSPVASAIVNNLAVQATIDGDLRRSDELYTEAARLAERFGDAASLRFIRANRIWMDFMLGRWERALADADAFIAECEAGSPHTLEAHVRQVRAMIRRARGELSPARSDEDRTVLLSRRRGDAGQLIAALSLSAAARLEDGHPGDARVLVDEIVPLVRQFGPHGGLLRLTIFAGELDALDELRAALDEGAGPRATRWRQALVAALAGDHRGAANVLASMGNLALEAQFRLHAGLRLLEEDRVAEGEIELEKALTFYRKVGASHHVAEIEGALAGAQSESA